MTLNEILNQDIGDIENLIRINPKEVQKQIRFLQSQIKRRNTIVERKGLITPYYKRLILSKGGLNPPPNNRGKLKVQFQELRSYLTEQPTKYNDIQKFWDDLKENVGISDMSISEARQFLDIWSDIKQRNPAMISDGENYERVKKYIKEQVWNDKSTSEILNDTQNYVNELSAKMSESPLPEIQDDMEDDYFI